jgi:hypothetical protein
MAASRIKETPPDGMKAKSGPPFAKHKTAKGRPPRIVLYCYFSMIFTAGISTVNGNLRDNLCATCQVGVKRIIPRHTTICVKVTSWKVELRSVL